MPGFDVHEALFEIRAPCVRGSYEILSTITNSQSREENEMHGYDVHKAFYINSDPPVLGREQYGHIVKMNRFNIFSVLSQSLEIN